MDLFNPGTLFTSLVWGSVGFGYFIYGKKQQSPPPAIGGILIIAASYFCTSFSSMTAASMFLIGAIHLALKQGW
jgi:hypothetical protein